MLSTKLVSPTKYQVIFLNSFSFNFDWYVMPLLLLGVLTSPQALFLWANNEKTPKWKILLDCPLSPAILAKWWQLVASVVALDPLHWAMCLVSYWHITMASKMACKYGAIFVFFWHATRQSSGLIQRKSSGFKWSPEPPPLVDVSGIVPVHVPGHQTG